VPPAAETALYTERMAPPVWAWLVAVVIGACFGAALQVALGTAAGLPAFVVAEALALFVVGRTGVRVAVTADTLRAGRGTLPRSVIASVQPLDPATTYALRGRDANPSAFHVIASWVPTAVRVDLADARDPTPYWFVSTRRPAQLAALLDPLGHEVTPPA